MGCGLCSCLSSGTSIVEEVNAFAKHHHTVPPLSFISESQGLETRHIRLMQLLFQVNQRLRASGSGSVRGSVRVSVRVSVSASPLYADCKCELNAFCSSASNGQALPPQVFAAWPAEIRSLCSDNSKRDKMVG